MDIIADAALKILAAIQSGAIGLTAVSIALNVYQFIEIRRLQRGWMDDMRQSLTKAEQRDAQREQLNAELISIVSAVDRKIRKPPT